jgi:CheY-like chemotaxis protein
MAPTGELRPDAPTVLLIDDNPLFLRVLAAVLESGTPAFRTCGVATAGGALAYLSGEGASGSERPDFVVLDFHLPDMDAPSVIQRLRRSQCGASVPVLVLTQAYWARDEEAALVAGATEFHPKPSTIAELRRILSEFWTRRLTAHAPGSGEGIGRTC